MYFKQEYCFQNKHTIVLEKKNTFSFKKCFRLVSPVVNPGWRTHGWGGGGNLTRILINFFNAILPILSTKWLKLCSLMLWRAFFSSKANSTSKARWAHRTWIGSSGWPRGAKTKSNHSSHHKLLSKIIISYIVQRF